MTPLMYCPWPPSTNCRHTSTWCHTFTTDLRLSMDFFLVTRARFCYSFSIQKRQRMSGFFLSSPSFHQWLIEMIYEIPAPPVPCGVTGRPQYGALALLTELTSWTQTLSWPLILDCLILFPCWHFLDLPLELACINSLSGFVVGILSH